MLKNHGKSYTKRKNGKELCDKIVDYILECPLDDLKDITVIRVTDIFKISKMHLIKCFKTYRNITPGRFIFREKMQRAKSLMQSNYNLTVKQVADILGFSTTDYFIRVFKKFFGKPPCQYRDCKARQEKEFMNSFAGD